MRITEIRVTPKAGGNFRGVASITLEDCFVVRGLKIIEDKAGRFFVSMPSRQKRDGSYQDVAHPITRAFRKQLEDAVMDKYNRLLETGCEDEPDLPEEDGPAEL